MNKFYYILAFLMIHMPSTGFTASYDFSSTNYDSAKIADSYVRFNMESTKLGIITTKFTGYLKAFKVNGDLKNETVLSGSSIVFNAKDLDTDVDGRNEKMWDLCLNSSQHPSVQIKLNKEVPLDGTIHEIPATLVLRGNDHAITLSVKAFRENKQFIVDISGELSIKGLKIPDPSIAIASVRDKIELTSHLVIKE